MEKCKKCGKDFFPKKGLKNFCSLKCRNSREWNENDKKKKSNSVKKFYKSKRNIYSKRERSEKFKLINNSNSKKEKTKKTWEEKIMLVDFESLSFESKRKRVIIEQKNKCNNCGIDKWLEHKITFELEHKNGNRKDNSRENLEALCPNCHSLTETWRGRNNTKKKVSEEELYKSIIESKSIRSAILKTGMSISGKNYEKCKKLINKYNLGM